MWWDGLIFYDVVIGGCVEYDVSDGQDEKIGSRVLFTGPATIFEVYDCGMDIIYIIKNLRNLKINSGKTTGHDLINWTALNNIKIIYIF